jgi:hypothetical protein
MQSPTSSRACKGQALGAEEQGIEARESHLH